jgi:4-hydroxybenzoate polyprenyltransferase
VSKGLANIIKLGDIDIQDIEGITIFFYVPGIISIMLPAFFLGRGIMLYKTVYLIVEIVAFVAVGILVVAIAYASENQNFLYISSIVNGFIMSMNMPLAYEIVTEQGYPFSEALTAGAVHAFYALFRLILKGLNRLLDEDNAGIASTAYCFVLIVLVFLSFILMFFARIKHRRLKMELKADK